MQSQELDLMILVYLCPFQLSIFNDSVIICPSLFCKFPYRVTSLRLLHLLVCYYPVVWSVKKYQTKLKEIPNKGTLGVLAIHENVKTTLCFFCIAHYFILVISIVPNFNIFVFSSFLQYLELRFNKYLRLCGTILFIIQTASKLQSCSMVLRATRIIWLSVTGCFL